MLLATIAKIQTTPMQNAIVWTTNSEGQFFSHWINGNQYAAKIIASKKGLILPIANDLWQLQFIEKEITTLACLEQEEEEEEDKFITTPVLSNLANQNLIEPFIHVQNKLSEENTIDELSIKIVGSIGPFLFVNYKGISKTCNNSQGTVLSGYLIIDLLLKNSVDLFTKDEAKTLLSAEQKTAFKDMSTNAGSNNFSKNDFKIKFVNPRFLNGLGMTLEYEFDYEEQFSNEERLKGTFNKKLQIEAQSIPQLLRPHALVPPALKTFAVFGDGITVGGWVPILGDNDSLIKLANWFLSDNQ